MSPEQPSNKIGKSVGEKLRVARIAQHYTQSQLAAPDFSVSYISAIERGQIHPSLRALEILAARLGMSSTQLLPSKAQQEERATAAAVLNEREEDEIELDLLNAQIQIFQDLTAAAITQLEQLGQRRLKRPQQLQQRYLLGQAYYKAAQYQESEYTLSEATHIAKELNAQYLNLHILHQLALTYAAMRNYAQAIQAHQRCLNQLEEYAIKDPFFMAQIYMLMGQHYTRLDNFEQALEMFHKALAITETLATPQQIQAIYISLSRHYAEARDNILATLYAYKSLQSHHQEALKRLRSELYHYQGHAIMQIDPEQARAYLDEALQNPQNTRDIPTHASLLTRNADWYFNQHQYDQAEESAQQAYALAQPIGDSIITADTLTVLGRIEYARQQYDIGSQHFVEGLDMLERLGSHEELANESIQYAELLEGLGKEREAFTHIRRAFESRQKLGR